MIIAFYNSRKPAVRKVLPEMRSFCGKRRIKFLALDGRKIGLLKPTKRPIWLEGKHPTLAVSLGGDGTFLTAARHVIDAQIPMLGINLGGLGFLAAADHSNWPAVLSAALENKLVLGERLVLSIKVRQLTKESSYLAVNDCTLRAGRSPRMLSLEIRLDPALRPILLRGDGLIISTPTGSTAYALSVGGPIVEPAVSAYLLAPIASHSLTHRPLVLGANRIVKVKLSTYHGENYRAMVFLDGQLSLEIKTGDEVTVSRYHKPLLILRNSHHSYFELLTEKFRWAS